MTAAAGPFATSPLLFFLTFAAAFAVYWYAAVEGRSAFTWRNVAVLGLFARLLLLPMPPGDDMARYLWEGRLVLAGENPYLKAPDDASLAPLRDSTWETINHKRIPAIYPPLAMGLFAGLAAWEPHPMVFKAAFTALDLAALGVLSALGVAPRIAAVYFLNPLLIFESAGNGHFESLPLLFCLLFLASLRRRRWHSAIWVALAGLSKISGLALLPVLVLQFGWRRGLAYAALAGGAVAAAVAWTGSAGTLAGFAGDFHYNDAVPWVLRMALGWALPPAVLSGFALALLIGCGLGLMRHLRGAEPARQGLAFMGLLLLFSPTLHPWYALWILPFAAVSLARPWLLFTGTAAAAYGAYAASRVTGRFREVAWLRLPEFLPPLLLAAWERGRSLRAASGRQAEATGAASGSRAAAGAVSRSAAPEASAGPIRVIIPVLNEEKSIGAVLAAIPEEVVGVIVVDNGCTDRTAEIAREHGATVVTEPQRGYGAACLRGIAALPEATGIVVFLDGDYSDYPEELPAVVAPIREGRADLVIGSRVLGNREPGALLPVARFGNWLSTRLVRWGWGFQYSDLGPFRAIRLSSLRALGMADRDFGWTIEMQVKALARGLRVREVAVSYRKRIGTSKISGTVLGSWRAGRKILTVIAREWLLGYSTESRK